MFALDLFNTRYEKELKEGAVDSLHTRRIESLNEKMQDLLHRARHADPKAKAALIREYTQLKSECMGYGTLVGEGNPYDLPGIDYDRPGDIKPRSRPHMPPRSPRGHPDDPDFMDPDQRRLRKEQERIRQAWASDRAKKGVAEGMEGRVVFSGTGANGSKYEIIQSGPTDFMIHADGKHIDTYSSLQRAMSVLKNEVPGLQQGVAEGTGQDSKSWMASIKQQYPDVRFVQARMMGAPIIALVNGKKVAEFDTKKGVAEENKNFGGYEQSPRAYGVGNFQRIVKANMGNLPTVTLEFANPEDNIVLDRKGIDLISDYYDGLENDARKNHFIYRTLPSADEVLTVLKRLGWQDAVQPELPGIPKQGELPLQEKKRLGHNSDVAAGDVKVARELQRLRSQYPAAKSDVEAVAKAEIDSSERSQQQLSAIKGANTEQDRLLKQLVALDKKQGGEIDKLDNENERLEQHLSQIERTNAKLAQAIGQMSGSKASGSTGPATSASSRVIDLIPNVPADAQEPAPKLEPKVTAQANPDTKIKKQKKSDAMSRMAKDLAEPRKVQGFDQEPAPSIRGDNVTDLDAYRRAQAAVTNRDFNPLAQAMVRSGDLARTGTDVEEATRNPDLMSPDDYDAHQQQQMDAGRRASKRRELQHELGHERNNLQVTINGRPWKVFPGRGLADSDEEFKFLQSMRAWAAKKSAATGKKWEVYLTGANPTVNELSTEKLGQYKTAAALDAGAADKHGDYKRADKRFSGIIKATKKQFAHDIKKHKPTQSTVESLTKEPANRKEYLDQRDKLFRMMSMETNPANKQIIKQALKDLEARYGHIKERKQGMAEAPVTKKPQPYNDPNWTKKLSKDELDKLAGQRYPKKKKEVKEESSTASEAVERAVLNRIMVAHKDLLMKFGPDKVMQAVEEVAYGVGDVDEIGTSDVSSYVNQVRQILGA